MIAIPLGLYIIDVILRIFYFVSYPRRILFTKLIGEKFVRIYFQNPSGYKPGQHINIFLPQIASTEAHTFSPISNPENKLSSVIIEVKRNWTRKLKEYLQEGKELTGTNIDGPFGQIDIPFFCNEKNLVLVAGGVGIAPIMSILYTLKYQYNYKDTTVHLIWSCRESELLVELADEIGQMLSQPSKLQIHLHVYHTGSDSIDSLIEENTTNTKLFFKSVKEERPNFSLLFQYIRESIQQNLDRKVSVFVCGSGSFRDVVLRSIPQSSNCFFNIHCESFSN